MGNEEITSVSLSSEEGKKIVANEKMNTVLFGVKIMLDDQDSDQINIKGALGQELVD